MIEVIGYVIVYLVVGFLFLPFPMWGDKIVGKAFFDETKWGLFGYMLVWPVLIWLALFILWVEGWEETGKYK